MNAVLGAALVCGLVLGTARVEAGETGPFHPCTHTEPGSLARLSVVDAASLRESLGATGIGRLLGSPSWQLLLKTAWTYADCPLGRLAGAWSEWSGQSLLDVSRLVQGALVLDLDAPAAGPSRGASRSAPPRGRTEWRPPAWTLAIELCGARREILEVASGVMRRLEERTGLESSARAVAGTDVIVWTHPKAPFRYAQVGAYLIVSSSGARIEAAVRAHADSAEGEFVGERVDCGATDADSADTADSVAGSSWVAPAGVSVERPEVLARIQLQPLIDWLLGAFATTVERRDVNAIMTASGIDALETLWFVLGRLDRDVETAWSVTSRGGVRGLLEVIQRGCGQLTDVSRGLELVPDGATRVHGMTLRAGSFLRGLDGYARRSVPEIGTHLDAAYHDIEALLGVSVSGDLFKLGSVSTYAFGIFPPVGGSVRDDIVLVRTDELRPYWRVLEKIVSRRGLPWRAVPPRPSADDPSALVRYVYMSLDEAGAEAAEDAPSLSTIPAAWCFTALSALLPAVARLDRPDGWTALSTSPQALVRYRAFYSGGAMLTSQRAAAAFVLESLEGSSAAVVLRESEVLAYASDELLERMVPLASMLTRAGIDLATLPPAEAFLHSDEPARARFEWSASGFTVRTHRVFPSAVVTALVATTALARPETASRP